MGQKKGYKQTKSHIEKRKRFGKDHHSWKGDNVSYKTLHQWVRRHKEKPTKCEQCRVMKPYDVANISGNYIRDVDDYEWLCRKCHMLKDGRYKIFMKYALGNTHDCKTII